MKTINLENAKRLQELGVTKDSHFFYDEVTGQLADTDNRFAYEAPAYTADEIGDMLPRICEYGKAKSKSGRGYWCDYNPLDENDHGNTTSSEILTDAMALMLIWLIENKYVEVGEINKETNEA